MNNTFCLGIFLALIFFKEIAWEFSAETVSFDNNTIKKEKKRKITIINKKNTFVNIYDKLVDIHNFCRSSSVWNCTNKNT